MHTEDITIFSLDLNFARCLVFLSIIILAIYNGNNAVISCS